ncbi:uncharacterized protein EDB91DRAFT_1076883 [Suillus paluster]|uniref:uncharacterized protein n=1 Tax=Suillus paluster TaxID=48578 RepID=UPI001B88732F|nr:uncharacterized protein EDB91DRAFT_1076883 [Suillus paluster]KAG1754786.1 hypothetical protein EDB91DRAFT_1076883 [Suillus paluster]
MEAQVVIDATSLMEVELAVRFVAQSLRFEAGVGAGAVVLSQCLSFRIIKGWLWMDVVVVYDPRVSKLDQTPTYRRAVPPTPSLVPLVWPHRRRILDSDIVDDYPLKIDPTETNFDIWVIIYDSVSPLSQGEVKHTGNVDARTTLNQNRTALNQNKTTLNPIFSFFFQPELPEEQQDAHAADLPEAVNVAEGGGEPRVRPLSLTTLIVVLTLLIAKLAFATGWFA